MSPRRTPATPRHHGLDVRDRLERLLAGGVRILAGTVRTSPGGRALRLDVAWDPGVRRRPLAPRGRTRRRRTAVTVPLAAADAAAGDRDRPLLLALAHVVGELAGITGLGMRILG